MIFVSYIMTFVPLQGDAIYDDIFLTIFDGVLTIYDGNYVSLKTIYVLLYKLIIINMKKKLSSSIHYAIHDLIRHTISVTFDLFCVSIVLM